jgi:hypothetical protein
MSGPAFLITRIEDPRDAPSLARDVLRNGLGSPTIRDAINIANGQDQHLAWIGNDDNLRIADDAAFMMIGNTDELYDACKATTQAKPPASPLWNVGTASGQQLAFYYTRIKVSSVQTDTLLMIASAGYLAGVNPLNNGWSSPPKQPGAWVQLFDDGVEPSVPRVVRVIKENEG